MSRLCRNLTYVPKGCVATRLRSTSNLPISSSPSSHIPRPKAEDATLPRQGRSCVPPALVNKIMCMRSHREQAGYRQSENALRTHQRQAEPRGGHRAVRATRAKVEETKTGMEEPAEPSPAVGVGCVSVGWPKLRARVERDGTRRPTSQRPSPITDGRAQRLSRPKVPQAKRC
jgi:hypothetical protein